MKYRVDILKLKSTMILEGFNTIGDFAQALGVTRNTVSAVFNGKNPTYSVMCAMAEKLELTTEKAAEIFFACDLRIA